MDHILICCVCLGDNSEDADEIIQCDNCGITVHEGCYGVDGESDSIMSSASENSTEPWFCDACKCGVSLAVNYVLIRMGFSRRRMLEG